MVSGSMVTSVSATTVLSVLRTPSASLTEAATTTFMIVSVTMVSRSMVTSVSVSATTALFVLQTLDASLTEGVTTTLMIVSVTMVSGSMVTSVSSWCELDWYVCKRKTGTVQASRLRWARFGCDAKYRSLFHGLVGSMPFVQS